MRVKTSRSLISGIEQSNRDEYKTKQMKNIEFKMMNFNRVKMRIEYKQKQVSNRAKLIKSNNSEKNKKKFSR